MNKYELVKKREGLNEFKVTIVADSNDADYITTIQKYKEYEFDGRVIDDLIELKGYEGSHALRDYDEDDDSYLDIPYGDIDSCHTLIQVIVEYTDSNGTVYDVKY